MKEDDMEKSDLETALRHANRRLEYFRSTFQNAVRDGGLSRSECITLLRYLDASEEKTNSQTRGEGFLNALRIEVDDEAN